MFDDKEIGPIVMRVTQFNMNAPVAQRIERRPPEPGAQVRVLPGAHCRGAYNETFLVFGAFTESKQVDNCSKNLPANTREYRVIERANANQLKL